MRKIIPIKSGISLCMMVKDEEALLEDCLTSAMDWVEEIIVVDTGSTDDTISICKRYGAKVFDYKWDSSFSTPRNYAMEQAGHPWILLLDADERLFREDGQKLLDFVAATSFDGAHFKVYNYVTKTRGVQYTLHNALRLVRNNGMYRFTGAIHEQIARVDGKPIENAFPITDIRLHHLGYLDPVVRRKNKRGRNIPLLLAELAKNPENSFMLFNLGNEYMAQGEYEEALAAYEKARTHCGRYEAHGPHLLLRSALCQYQLKRYAKAMKWLDEGLSIYLGCTDMQFLKGMIYMDWGRDILAVDSFQRAIDMGEPSPVLRFSDGCATTRPLLSMALIYERQQDYVRAAECYGKALQADNQLYSALYHMARVWKKMRVPPTEMHQALARFFSDLTYPPNRILLADILLSQRLCAVCEEHMKSLANIAGYETEKALLSGKYFFCTKQYEKARSALRKACNKAEGTGMFARLQKEGVLLLFLTMLMEDTGNESDWADTMEAVGKQFGRPGQLVCCQIQIVLAGGDKNLLEGENPQPLLEFFSVLLKHVLENGAFDLFEQLLYVYNAIDSPRVLLSLAQVYWESGLTQLAAHTVLRSIQELDTVDAQGARMLADGLFLEQSGGEHKGRPGF